MKKRNKNTKSNSLNMKNQTKQSHPTKDWQSDPISSLLSFIKTRYVEAATLLIFIITVLFFFLTFLFVFITLSLWGVRREYILMFISSNPLEYIVAIGYFAGIFIFTFILEILRKISNNGVKKFFVYIFYPILASIFLGLLLQFSLFSTMLTCLFALMYTSIYLIILRPHYSKNHRKLAENALNYNSKRYRTHVVLIEYGLIFGHMLVVIALTANLYSIMPRTHFMNEHGTEIIVHFTGDQVLISEFQIMKTQSGERYIVLNRDAMRISTMSNENFTMNTERLFISGIIGTPTD